MHRKLLALATLVSAAACGSAPTAHDLADRWRDHTGVVTQWEGGERTLREDLVVLNATSESELVLGITGLACGVTFRPALTGEWSSAGERCHDTRTGRELEVTDARLWEGAQGTSLHVKLAAVSGPPEAVDVLFVVTFVD